MPGFVITGASGGGKSTLIEALSAKGVRTVREIGRDIVRDQLSNGGNALPWSNKIAFRDLLFARSIAAYDEVQPEFASTIVFDRSFVEAIAYSHRISVSVPKHFTIEANARPFSNPIFVCPPWLEIFTTDTERRAGFGDAIEDYEINVAAYEALGYTLQELPRTSVEDRIGIILATIRNAQDIGSD